MSDSYFIARESCPACKSASNAELYSVNYTSPPISSYLKEFYAPQGGVEFAYLEHARYCLVECKVCGLVYQRFIPNDFLMVKLYEQWIDPEKSFESKIKRSGIEYYACLAREIEMTVRYFNQAPNQLEYLDFGMGWGDWCLMAKAYGCVVCGTEISPARISYAKESGIPVISWEEISNHQFDLINAEQVFEHIAKPLETLRYLQCSLKPHGLIKISVPNGWDIKRRLAILDWKAPKGSVNSLNPVAPLEHINCYSQGALVRMAQLAGLVPIEIPKENEDQRILDLTARDILRPFYYWIARKPVRRSGSIKLFFQKE